MAKRHRLLMCPPDFFTVKYAINPWMRGKQDEVSVDEARRQWQGLYDVLARYADIELLAPVDGLPDMVFTANAGVVYHDRALVSRFKYAERHGEEAPFRAWFEDRGFKIWDWPEDLYFEGAGDALLDRRGQWVWTGYGQRSMRQAIDRLDSFYPDREVVPLRLIDPRFYHVDTCLAPLESGHLIYFPEAFDVQGRKEIEKRVPAELLIPVTSEEAVRFSCNAVDLGQVIAVNKPGTRLTGRLKEAGYDVIDVDLSQFIKSGGSAKCLVLRIDEP